MKKLRSINDLQISNLLVAIVFILVPFHAFLTVFGSTIFGHFTLLRLWDEGLIGALVVLTAVHIIRDQNLLPRLLNNTLARLILAYCLLTIVLASIAFAAHRVALKALLYGLTINLRFLVWFLCVWFIAQRSNWLLSHWKKLIFFPLSAVLIFGIAQFFILPNNFLSHFGYGPHTYVPYVTINQDTSTMRVQSFLRGANPLGAYLAAMVGILVSLVTISKKKWYLWLLSFGTLLVLYLSFSRSGFIGAIIAIMVGGGLRLRSKRHRRIGAIAVTLLALVVTVNYLRFSHNTSIQDAVLHVSSRSTASRTSNEGHLASLKQSLIAIAHQPFGGGPGTSGQASWYNTGHQVRNTESYFLQIAEEDGWIGIALFVAVLYAVGQRLWARKNNPLAVGLLASLVGLLLISQLSYAWDDDTLAFVWWGLAGLAMSLSPHKLSDTREHTRHDTPTHLVMPPSAHPAGRSGYGHRR